MKGEFDINSVKAHKIEVRCLDDESFSFCLEFLKEHPEYGYFESISERIVEIYAKKNTKATGIEKALDYLGIPITQSYAFGDGKNDIEMLEAVGCGIAMGNASDEVKSYADQVTDTVQNDGVAIGIEKYMLNTLRDIV